MRRLCNNCNNFPGRNLSSSFKTNSTSYNYSSEDVFELRVDENETVGNFVETIKESNIDLDNAKFLLKVDLPSDELSDKLAFLEANPSANIKKTLDSERVKCK
jgi:hypothetical protein